MSSVISLTPREQELLTAVAKTATAIDWDAVALEANFTTSKQARDKWAALRTKLGAGGGKKKDASDNGTEAVTPKKATPKKRKAATENTPAKGKKGKKVPSPANEAEEDEEVAVKPEVADDDDLLK